MSLIRKSRILTTDKHTIMVVEALSGPGLEITLTTNGIQGGVAIDSKTFEEIIDMIHEIEVELANDQKMKSQEGVIQFPSKPVV